MAVIHTQETPCLTFDLFPTGGDEVELDDLQLCFDSRAELQFVTL